MRQTYRMSGMVVLVGYVLLIPTFVGIFVSIVAMLVPVQRAGELQREFPTIQLLTGGVGLIVSLCGGLLGWILTMKKRVLQCTVCKATISAS